MEAAEEALKVSESAVKTAQEAPAVATKTATDATAAYATMKAERHALRDTADDKQSLHENA